MPQPPMLTSQSPRTVTNFGRNISFRPQSYYEPRDEREVLDVLRRHPGEAIRVIGSLHSWSRAVEGDGVVLCLRHLNRVDVHQDADGAYADIGAGAQIKAILSQLRRHGDWTLPAIGIITEQAIAGAAATGTHGSGNHSISHYLQEVRLATCDPETGEPTITTIDSGPELQAARCSLGCLGIVLSVRVRCREQYVVAESNRCYDDIRDILQAEADFPLQHFYLVPHRWKFFAQHRRVVGPDRHPLRKLDDFVYAVNFSLFMDVGIHFALYCAARIFRSNRLQRIFCRLLPIGIMPEKREFHGRSDQVLTLKHDYFRHIELEFFVPRRHVEAAAEFLTAVLKVLDGREIDGESALAAQLQRVALLERLEELRGSYTHGFPICIRRILPDDTLISMSAGEEDWYSFSLVSMQPDAEPFDAMARFVATAITRLFQGRLHWGKWFPLGGEYAQQAYPRLAQFAEICRKHDPEGVFQNDFTREILAQARSKAPIDVGPAVANRRRRSGAVTPH